MMPTKADFSSLMTLSIFYLIKTAVAMKFMATLANSLEHCHPWVVVSVSIVSLTIACKMFEKLRAFIELFCDLGLEDSLLVSHLLICSGSRSFHRLEAHASGE
jgi:hypothetical protein